MVLYELSIPATGDGQWGGQRALFCLPEISPPRMHLSMICIAICDYFSWDQHCLKRLPHLEGYERFFIIRGLAKFQWIFYSGLILNTSSIRILALSLHDYGQSTSACRASVSLPVNVCLGSGE